MIHQLEPGAYEKARPLFDALQHHLVVRAIIKGTIPGKIIVDDPDDPKAALTWFNQRVFLAGSSRDADFHRALNQLFINEITPQAINARKVAFVVYYAPQTWEDHVEAVFWDKFPIQDRRLFFSFKALKHDWHALIPPDCTMQRVDRGLLAQTHLKNLDVLEEEVLSEGPSIDDFFSNRFGFCLIRVDEIVSWCLSEFNTGDRCEVGIETVQAYQKRGFATLTASALIEHALANGIAHIGWHCWAGNAGSIALAQKVGFVKVCEYPVFFAWFDTIDNLLVHGWFCLHRLKAYEEAARWYERAFELGEERPWALYDGARAQALAGVSEAAFGNLNRAITAGWTDFERLKTDPDLEGLRATKDWQDLIDKLGLLRNRD